MSEFDEIYRLYAEDVYRFLLRISGSADIAEELTSETFYKAVKSIDSYRGDCKMSVWLISIGKNLYFDYLKKAERKNSSLDGCDLSDGSDIILSFENKEQAMKIHKALHTLEEPFKEVFSLRIFGELSFKEIGSLFGRSDGWARTVFFRAKEKIINELKESEQL